MRTSLNPGRAIGLLLTAVLVAACFTLRSTSAENAITYGKPIYSPEAKAYFELWDDAVPGYWKMAKQRAESRSFKGVRGRLAVVKSKAVHDFLRAHFPIRTPAWIGMRYWCPTRELQWVNGEPHTRKGFNIWAARWYRHDQTVCGLGAQTRLDQYMPVYYLAVQDGFTWQAAGAGKGFKWYFVEYPTGQP